VRTGSSFSLKRGGGESLAPAPRNNQPVQVSIVSTKKGKTKQDQIDASLSQWQGGDSELKGAPGFVTLGGVGKEHAEVVEEFQKSRVGADSSSNRARDIQNLRSRGLEWEDDAAHPACHHCANPFSVVTRRHHCRLCGRIFCSACCPPNKEVPFPAILNHNFPVRACCLCFNMDSLDAHTDELLHITSLSTGEIISASADHSIRIWEVVWEIDNTSGGQCVATLCGHTEAVTQAVELSPGRIVSVSKDKTLKIWEMEDTKKGGLIVNCLGSLRFADSLNCVIVREGKILVGTTGGNILVCRLAAHEEGTIEVISSLKGHTNAVLALKFHEKGYLLSGSADSTVRFWDLNSDSCLAVLTGHQGPVTSIAMIPGTHGCFISGSEDKTLRIWKVILSQTQKGSLTGTPKFLASLCGHTEGVTDVKISKMLYIVSASKDKSIVIWSLETGKVIARFRGHTGGVNSIFVMPSGLVISGSSDKSMRVWKYTPPSSK